MDGVEQVVLAWVGEALDLRHGVAGDPDGRLRDTVAEAPNEIVNLLRRVRARSDRVDELLANATRAKARAFRAKDEAEFTADNALHQATQDRANKRREFEASVERQADAKLSTFEERRAAHQAKRLVSVTTEAYDVISQVHWQLDALRKDLRDQLRAFQFESSLER